MGQVAHIIVDAIRRQSYAYREQHAKQNNRDNSNTDDAQESFLLAFILSIAYPASPYGAAALRNFYKRAAFPTCKLRQQVWARRLRGRGHLGGWKKRYFGACGYLRLIRRGYCRASFAEVSRAFISRRLSRSRICALRLLNLVPLLGYLLLRLRDERIVVLEDLADAPLKIRLPERFGPERTITHASLGSPTGIRRPKL